LADSKDFFQGAVYATLDVRFAWPYCSARKMAVEYTPAIAPKFKVVLATLFMFFRSAETRRAVLAFVTSFSRAKPIPRQE
jgi:hypothetical protein